MVEVQGGGFSGRSPGEKTGTARPGEAIDWLMKEAKSAIDALDKSADQNPDQELDEHHRVGILNSGYFGEEPINSLGFFGIESLTNAVMSTEFDQHLSGISSASVPKIVTLFCLKSSVPVWTPEIRSKVMGSRGFSFRQEFKERRTGINPVPNKPCLLNYQDY
ncbi:hypothetical protein Acr_00g0101290 [Actinidia rufa]|uniref:Uncharacterized protein n=1 Tax=Actinidia rufa TaxID=165716 RepID=A0A7J0E003_9ERIC|nr:hypothetical protein Acr_00g0101290 [Actinidia rufa]